MKVEEMEMTDDHEVQSNQHSSSITFSAEKEQLFKAQYEERYDLYNEEYLQCLSIHHPYAIPKELDAPDAPPDLLTLVCLMIYKHLPVILHLKIA